MARSAPHTRRRGVPWWAPLLALAALVVATGAVVVAQTTTGGSASGGATTSAQVLGAQTVMERPKPVAKAKPAVSTPKAAQAKAATLALRPGMVAAEHSVRVLAVVGPRIFWVGPNRAHRVLVHLQGPGTRRLVLPGQRVTFAATVAANSVRAAARWGLTRREGRDQFGRQRVHFEVYGPRMRFVSA